MPTDTSSPSPSHSTQERTGLARMLDACHLRQPDATPIWFMRQAGSCLADHREMRKKYDVLRIAKTPELCTEVSVMAVREYGVDAAVLYADIMLPLEGMGVSLELTEVGPIIHNPIRTRRDIEALSVINAEDTLWFVMEAIRMVRHELNGQQAVIGFSGGPFTLAYYLIEGGPSRDYPLAKTLMYGHPELWDALMTKLTDVVIDYLLTQIRAGIDVVQLFDSWVGTLNPGTYRRFVLPYSQRIFQAVKQTGVPAIHFGTGTAALMDVMMEAGGDLIGVDWRVHLDDAWAQVGYDHGIQGNLDSTVMFTEWPTIESAVQDILDRAGNRPGHIFNFGHAVQKGTNPDQLRRVVDLVHERTQR